MKLRKFSLALMATFALGVLASCSRDEQQSGATVASMKLNSGFPTAYMTDAEIDWSKFSVTLTYSDKNQETITSSYIEYDVETTAEATRLVVNTDGLHAQAHAQEGEYKISAAVPGALDKTFDLATVVVGKIVKEKYELTSFDVPEFVETYKAARESAGQSGEQYFYQGDEIFTVGTMNPFEFEPIATFRNIETRQIVPSTNYVKSPSLKVKNETTYVDADPDDYQFVEGGVKFNNSAVGKQFKYSVTPTDFPTIFGEDVVPAEIVFKVEKGFNVYNAKQLAVLNVTTHDAAYFYDHPYVSHYGIKNNATKENGCDDVFWNGSSYVYLDTTALWREFLINSGTFTEEELQVYHDVPAVFLMDTIDITKDDMPSEFFVVDGETGNTGVQHNGQTGSLRDAVVVYHPLVENNDIVINGNYFTLNANTIKLCNSTWKNGLTCYTGEEERIDPGHATLFKFCGPDVSNYHENQVDVANGKKGIIKNINTLGNTVKNVATEDTLQVTGLIFGKNTYCGADYTNNLIKQYQIGVFPDHHVGQTLNLNASREDNVFNTNVSYCKIFDCSNAAICNYQNGGAYVSHSTFNRFGGAPILNAGSKDSVCAGLTFFAEDVVFDNLITGAEVYFAAVGASGEFGSITGFNALFNGYYAKSLTNADGKMNLVELNMDGHDYVGSPNKAYYSEVYLNYGLSDELHCSIGGATNIAWNVFAGTGYAAPTFATETGVVFYFDGHNFIDYETGEALVPSKLTGNYVSILLPVGTTTLNATFRLYNYTPAA